MKTHTQEIFTVKQVESTKQWFWTCTNSKNHQHLGNCADFHKSKKRTVVKAQEMALGRPVYLETRINGVVIRQLISGAPLPLPSR